MQITFNRSVLASAMAALAEVATRGERIADGCVLIRARTDGTVTAAASNLSWSVVLSLGQAEVAEAGEVMVLAGKLREDISRRRGELVTLSTEADTLLVIDEESRFGHATHHAGDFLHRTPPAALAQVNGAVLLRLAERAVVAGDEVSFPGVRLEADGNGVRMIGTDGRRLSTDAGAVLAASGVLAVNLPIRPLKMLGRLLDDPDEAVRIGADESLVGFATDSMSLVCCQREGAFPEWKKLLASHADGDLAVGCAAALASAVDHASLFVEDGLGVAMELSQSKVELSSASAGHGSGRVKVEGSYVGPTRTLWFSPKLLRDGLKPLGAESAMVRFNDKRASIRSGAYEYLVMSMQPGGAK